jgi:hypothetical protein
MRSPIDYSQNLLIASPNAMTQRLAFEVAARTRPRNNFYEVSNPHKNSSNDLRGLLYSLGVDCV